ncbi:MAG: hypothetical protein Q7V31_13765 [Parvibaculum sp.]|nr:hypothetical protein [Parvibaculum sp.]MDO8839986.1 hypothetical protein [Parvibaculum sp.]
MADHRHEPAHAPESWGRVSAFGTGLAARLAVAGAGIVVLWLAVFWALAR